jgi:putative ABC transport system ATP-binding protein
MSGSLVLVDGVSKRYRAEDRSITALREVSLRVDPGAVVALMGPSGSGKSTLLHVIGAMDAPDSGSIQVDGVEITALDRAQQASYRRGVGFVFQRFHLLPALTNQDNVAAPLLPYRSDFDERARALELLELVGLRDRADSLPSKLSGGQQQRVAIARALINRPPLLLADEPTGNLDSATGAEVIDLILDLRERLGMTVLIATHDQSVASRCERTFRMRDGSLL